MRKLISLLVPLGMISAIVYMTHVLIGQALWPAYNPITTDISSLTAVGAPNAALLRVFTGVYGACFVLFALGMALMAFHRYGALVRAGYCVLLVMALVSAVGYSLFPLGADKTVMDFQNGMHLAVTIIVVLTTILSGFLTAVGYLKTERAKALGVLCLIAAVLMTGCGALNPLNMRFGWNILGLTERLVIFTLQAWVFALSFAYTFRVKGFVR